MMGAIMKNKFFDETLVELGHPIEDLYVLWHFWCMHIHDGQKKFGSGNFLTLETTYPNMTLE
jgi:hypothetical protein